MYDTQASLFSTFGRYKTSDTCLSKCEVTDKIRRDTVQNLEYGDHE